MSAWCGKSFVTAVRKSEEKSKEKMGWVSKQQYMKTKLYVPLMVVWEVKNGN